MADALVYRPDYSKSPANEDAARWHSNHRIFSDLLPGDRLWVMTSGKNLGLPDQSAGYLVGMWPVAAIIENPGDNPDYPAPKYQHRVLVSETEAIHLDEPVCVDHLIRGEGYDSQIPIGRFLRGPRRLTDKKVRRLGMGGAEMARKWLTASKQTPETAMPITTSRTGAKSHEHPETLAVWSSPLTPTSDKANSTPPSSPRTWAKCWLAEAHRRSRRQDLLLKTF